MAGQVSKEELESVLMQAMLAAKNLGPQRDRLQQLRRRLPQLSPGDDGHADRIKELASNLFKVYFIGIEAGARSLTTCLQLAAQNGARLALNPAFGVMPDEQLYDALLTQRLPARPITQTEAFSRVEAALYAVKLTQEHHLPRCIEHLVGVRPPLVVAESSDESSEDEDEDEPVAAVAELLAKTDLTDPAPAATGEPPQAAASSSVDLDKAPQAATSSSVDLDKARDYLDRACTLASLAVKHIDLAVVVLSRFMDPKKVASLSEFTDSFAYISEEGPYPSD